MGDSVHFIDAESVRCEFSEGCLGKMNGDVAAVVAEPGEGSAKEEVNIAHEVDFDVLGEFRTKDGFFGGVCDWVGDWSRR